MIPAGDPRAPLYWMNETSGVLKPVVEQLYPGQWGGKGRRRAKTTYGIARRGILGEGET